MITNVTTVLVGTGVGTVLTQEPANAASMNTASADAFKYILMDMDNGSYTVTADTKRFKVGMVLPSNTAFRNPKTKKIEYKPIVKWSNMIDKSSIKSFTEFTYQEDTEDKATITFNKANGEDPKRILLRITYKDMTTRFRKWTETYEFIAMPNTTAADIAKGFEEVLNRDYKRNRVYVTRTGNKLVLEAMQYDDDNKVDTINVANKVRFEVHMYYTLPNADGWASKNKYAYDDATIVKEEGKQYKASSKLVRDREAWAMGYEGILNRGECTWPIIKPEMNTNLSAHYDGITLEWQRSYRAADDIIRETRETLEIYDINKGGSSAVTAIKNAINSVTSTPAVSVSASVISEADIDNLDEVNP